MNLTIGSAASRARAWLSGAADLLLPPACAACGGAEAIEDRLCRPCAVELLSLVARPYCRRCGATVGPNIPDRDDGCSACPDPLPRFEAAVRLGPYAGPLRQIIRRWKYRRMEAMRGRLGRMLAQAVASRCAQARLDVVVPVPMHWWRRIRRGYDHALAIAGALAGELRLPLGRELVRVRDTRPQIELSRSRRAENVRGAFAAASPASLAGACVLLVDDVTTTGATANEAARTLLSAGASSVVLAVLAKAEPPRAYATRW